jgi:transcription antitermination factor NusG
MGLLWAKPLSKKPGIPTKTTKPLTMEQERKWHAVYTRPKWERKVSTMLTQKKIQTYCPLTKVVRQWSDRKKTLMEPLFNSYVFVHASSKEYHEIKQSDGVINFVYWLGCPAVIKEEEINTIKTFLEEHETVTLEKAQVSINDRIRITSGPLIDLEGSVLQMNSRAVKVYLPSLGYQMLAEISKTNVQVIDKYQTKTILAS